MNQDDIEKIEAFASAASDYIGQIERTETMNAEALLTSMRQILPRLYLLALALPETEARRANDPPRLSHDDWQMVFEGLTKTLGEYDLYWEVYNPVTPVAEEPIACTLSDDLADVWRDLKNGLNLYRSDDPDRMQSAAWSWRFHFKSHWSCHAVDALRAINTLIEKRFLHDN